MPDIHIFTVVGNELSFQVLEAHLNSFDCPGR